MLERQHNVGRPSVQMGQEDAEEEEEFEEEEEDYSAKKTKIQHVFEQHEHSPSAAGGGGGKGGWGKSGVATKINGNSERAGSNTSSSGKGNSGRGGGGPFNFSPTPVSTSAREKPNRNSSSSNYYALPPHPLPPQRHDEDESESLDSTLDTQTTDDEPKSMRQNAGFIESILDWVALLAVALMAAWLVCTNMDAEVFSLSDPTSLFRKCLFYGMALLLTLLCLKLVFTPEDTPKAVKTRFLARANKVADREPDEEVVVEAALPLPRPRKPSTLPSTPNLSTPTPTPAAATPSAHSHTASSDKQAPSEPLSPIFYCVPFILFIALAFLEPFVVFKGLNSKIAGILTFAIFLAFFYHHDLNLKNAKQASLEEEIACVLKDVLRKEHRNDFYPIDYLYNELIDVLTRKEWPRPNAPTKVQFTTSRESVLKLIRSDMRVKQMNREYSGKKLACLKFE